MHHPSFGPTGLYFLCEGLDTVDAGTFLDQVAVNLVLARPGATAGGRQARSRARPDPAIVLGATPAPQGRRLLRRRVSPGAG